LIAITAADKLKELKRELAQRRRVYPRLIEKGSLTREAAARQTEIMEAIVADYEARAAEEERQGMLL
jgi:hypothetical protein